jgi:peptide-methionine (S)-S-oxide reductase
MKLGTLLLLSASVLASAVGCRSAAVPEATAKDMGDATASPAQMAKPMGKPMAVAETKIGVSPGRAGDGTPLVAEKGHALAAFAEGCFWGSENTFRKVRGVVATAVGYTGGSTKSPTYETVCSHTTGHAETVLVEYDPSQVTYAHLLEVFFKSHDPTTKNRQGPDVGDQYRSAIFTLSADQEAEARAAIQKLQSRFDRPITTLVSPLGQFWKAEDYHQQYDEKSGQESCAMPGNQSL